jgi:hypothetical protein
MVTALGATLATLLLLLPCVVFLVLRSRAERPAWLIALDLPAALSLDIVVTLIVARVVVLDVAVWITKGLWLVVGAAVYAARARKGWRPRWPAELDRLVVLQCVVVGVVGLLLSMYMSRRCQIWDRPWHVPLIAAFRGQTVPFVNVYEPWKELHYHIGGDLLAAALQATSLGILHASHGLSLAHDFCFFWFGVTTTLVLRRLGFRHFTLLLLVFLGMLLASPVVPLIGEKRTWFAGYSTTNWFSLSYRPHLSLAALVKLAFFAVPLVRLRELDRDVETSELLVPLTLSTAAMLVIDEISMGLLGLGLGVVWLAYPRVFGPTRKSGAIFLGALAAAFLFGILTLKGAIAPGAPSYPLKLLFPRSPGFYTAPHRLDTALGFRLFLADLLPILTTFFGGAWLAARSRDPATRGAWLMFATITVFSVFVFATLSYKDSGLENHRFIIAPMLFAPLFVAAWLLPRPGEPQRVAGLVPMLMLVVVALGAASSVDWFGNLAFNDCRTGELSLSYYQTNCRAETGGGVETARTKPMYVDPAILYLYTGCRPAYVSGPPVGRDRHDVKMGTARSGLDALAEVARDPHFGVGDEDLTIICDATQASDPACAAMQRAGACKPSGTAVLRCTMTPAQREDVLRAAGK